MNIQDYLDNLAELVNIDSGTQTTEGVAAVAEVMRHHYQQAGWHCDTIDLGPQVGPGLLARNKPQAGQFDLLLIGHMDTVFPAGTAQQRPFTTRDGFAYGPGVSDMKGGLLSLLWAVRGLDKSVTEKLSIAVAMNPDEETGSVHSEHWLGELAQRSRCVLVAEPGRADGSLVKARKGVSTYFFSVRGVAAHAGNEPEKGRSAINALAQLILEVNKLAAPEVGTTLNFGTLRGGIGTNVVADAAEAGLDLRFWDNQEYQRVNQALMALNNSSPGDGITVQVRQEAYKLAMAPSPETEKLMALVEQAGREEDVEIKWKAVGGGSDANHTASLGIPSLDGFGPAGGAFHSSDEYLQIDTIEPRIRLLQRVISKL
ncbi:MAG: M20 family metallopeptidase [Enterobacteriaceae bacterium]